ncbi:MAG: hypothetical protein E7353_00300 [Clostridiales bacterium]|nr:hypothetical protein [Clostridiales bacterium]
MVILRKKEVTKNSISYYYKLYDHLKEGVLIYYPKQGTYEVEILAEEDDLDYPKYRDYAIYKIEQYYLKNNYPEEDLVAWG